MRIEQGGKPTVVIVAPAFKQEFIHRAALHGTPYLPFVIVNYDQEFLPIVPAETEKVFDKMVKALITAADELEQKIPGEVI